VPIDRLLERFCDRQIEHFIDMPGEDFAYVGPIAGAPAASGYPAGAMVWDGDVKNTWQSTSSYWNLITPETLGSLPNYTAAKQRINNPPRIAFVGDSNVAGQGASGITAYPIAREGAFPVLMAKSLNWQTGTFVGDQKNTANSVPYAVYDPRVALGSFSVYNGSGLGAGFFSITGASATAFSFTPEMSFTDIELYIEGKTNSTNSFSVLVDDTVVYTGSSIKASTQCFKLPLAFSGSNIKITNSGAGELKIFGVLAYSKANTAPILIHAGYRGGKMSDMIFGDGVSIYHYGMLKTFAPDLVVLYCTINDLSTGTAEATITANINTFVNGLNSVNCDVICISPFPFNNAKVTDGTLDRVAFYQRSKSEQTNSSFADCRTVFGPSFTVATSKGLVYDNLHPSRTGHEVIAELVGKLFA